MNLLCNLERPELEEEVVDLCLKYGVRFVEAAAFIQLTPSIVRYRLHGIRQNERGEVVAPNRVLAKCRGQKWPRYSWNRLRRRSLNSW